MISIEMIIIVRAITFIVWQLRKIESKREL